MLTVARAVRMKKGLSMRQVAEQVGCDYNTLSQFELGKGGLPVKSREKLAALLGVKAERLFDERGMAKCLK